MLESTEEWLLLRTQRAFPVERAKRVLRRVLGIEGLDTKDHDILVALGLVVAAVAVGIRFFFWWYTGRVWEDALITVLHSENFVNGLGMTHYRVGEPPLHGFTSPLSVLVPLIGDLFKAGFGLSFIKIVSAFAGGLTVLYVMAIAIHPKVRLPAPLAFMVMGYVACEHHQILWGMSGMETQIVTLVLLASLYYTIAAKPVALGIVLGFCMLARPDFAFWTVIVGLYVLVTDWRGFLKVVAVAAVIYAPWILFTTWYYGSPVPNTILAKSLGYPLWSAAPSLTWADILRNVAGSFFDPHSNGALFLPLGPCFGGHGGFRPLWHDHGAIGNAMMVLALIGAGTIAVKRQWALLPAPAFILVYGVYYVFFVAIIFGWYVVPFAAMTLLLSARGIQAIGGIVRISRLRTIVWSAVAITYVLCFVTVLPLTFATEKRIQEDVEDQVRVQIGRFLGHIMDKDQTVGCEPLGYIAYYSRRTVYDWPGLASRKVVEYSKTHPEGRTLMGMLEHFEPDFIVLRYSEYEDSYEQTWIDTNYRIIASFEALREKIQDIFAIAHNVDTGFLVLAKRDWIGGANTYHGMSLGIDPRHARAHACVGFRLTKQGRLEEALAHLNESLRLDSGDCETYNTLGLALVALGRYPEAMEQFNRALELNPQYALAFNNRAVCSLQQGNRGRAIQDLYHAVQSDPSYVEGYTNLANVLASVGRLDEAADYLRTALKIEPYNKEARAGLQWVQAAQAKARQEPR
jgi:tetratricopeptide (TPR) repeat protein